MRNKHRNQTVSVPFSSCLVATAVLILLLLLVGSSVAFAQDGSAFVRKVREIEARDLDLSNPAGLSFSPGANAFHIVEARRAGQPDPSVSDITVVTPVQGQVDTVRISASFSLANPINMAFDSRANRLLLLESATEELIEIAAGPGGLLDPAVLTRHDARRFGLQNPQGMTLDPASGHLFVLDSAVPNIVRIEPDTDGSFREAGITPVDLARASLSDPRGLALNPANGNLYILVPTQQELYELTQTGLVVAVYDLSAFALSDPQGMVFAPSGDLTDDPARMSLYIADTGLGAGYDRQAASQTGGKIIELSFAPLAPIAVTDTAELVRVIDTSLFSPPSPDPSGITYLESSDTLLISDSEVEEMPPYFTGDNLFEITLDGTLSDTLTTIGFTDEPTGIAYNPANRHLFISDDNAQRIYELDPGPDGRYDTTDDIITSIRTWLFNSTDPEGVAFDSRHGVLFISDGVNSEVYRVAPGANGVFDDVPPYGDDEVTSFDTESFGLVDAGGITYDTENGHLYLVGWPRANMAHVTTTGTLLRMVDISAADATWLAGLTMAPRSQDHGVLHIYITDRGVDNGQDPLENDGKVYEMYVPAITPDVAIVKDVQPVAAQAGEVITYTLSFSNLGGGAASGVVLTDIIPVSVTVQSVVSSGVAITDTGAAQPYVWEVQDLATFEGGVITVTAALSQNLSCWQSFTNTASITATGDTRLGNNSSDVSVTVGSSVTVSPTVDTASTDQGSELVYTLQVTNTGNCTDTFDVSVSGTSWTVTTPITVGPLSPDTGASVDVTVTVPVDAPCGPESATITFTSQGDGTTSDSSILTTSANPVYGLTVDPSSAASGDPGTGAVHTLSVTNTGNCTDTFLLSASGGLWSVNTPDPVGPVAAGMDANVNVTVTVPTTATCGDDDSATLTVTSQGDGTKTDSSDLTTSANPVSGLAVTPASDGSSGDQGAELVYTLQVTNTGNCTDTFDVSVGGTSWTVTAPLTVGLLAPDVGTSVDVTVTIPLDAPCGDEAATLTFTSQGDGTTSQSSILTTTVNAVSGVTIVPSSATDAGDPDSDVVYTLQLTNTGNCEDIFALAVSDHTWPTVVPASTGPVTAGLGTSVNVTVTVPTTATCSDHDSATLTATSQGDGITSGTSSLTTLANPVSGLAVTPTSDGSSGDPGTEIVYTLQVTNTGNCTDTFDVSVGGTSWTVTAPLTVGLLAPDVGASVDVTVTIPLDAPCGDEAATVTFTSQGDGTTSQSSILTTTVNAISGVTIVPASDADSADPEGDVVYTLQLTNTGNCEDVFALAVGDHTWPTVVPASTGPVTAGLGTNVNVTVTVPTTATCSDHDSATLTATSQGDGITSDSSSLTTSVNPVSGLALTPATDSGSGDPGTDVVYTLRITNTGNCTDTFDVSVGASSWAVTAPPTVGLLAPGVGADVAVTVTVPSTANCGDADSTIVTFTSQGDGLTSASSTLNTSANTVYGASIIPPAPSAMADPGSDVLYMLWLLNSGNCEDSFDLSISGTSWPVTAPLEIGPLTPGVPIRVDVTVTVPLDAPCGDDAATLTATSRADPTSSGSAILTTSVNPVYKLTVEPASDSASGDPDTGVPYTLQVTNTGNCEDIFNVAVSGNTWSTVAPATTEPVTAGASVDVSVTVTVPQEALCGDFDHATVTFTSQGEGSQTGSTDLTTSANPVHGLTVQPSTDSASGDPGTDVVYTLQVTNTGNCADTFDLAVSGNSWTTVATPTIGPVAPGLSASVDVTVTVPQDALCTVDDIATITFTSQGDGTKTDSSDLTTTANAVSGVTVTPPSSTDSGDPGADVLYTLQVTNTGNCADTFDLAVSGNSWTTVATPTIGPVAPGLNASVDVTVTVPQDALCTDGDTATITLTSQGDGTTAATSDLTTTAYAVFGVTVTPPSSTGSGDPGTDVLYTLQVTNTGNCTDTFTIAASGYDWPTNAPATSGLLAPGAGSDVDVTVTVPQHAQCGDGDTSTFTFTSQGDGTTSTTSDLTTTANTVRAATILPSIDSLSGDVGDDLVYGLSVLNSGNCADTFDITVSGNTWTTDAPTSIGPLAPGFPASLAVTVTVPLDAQCGSDVATITATPQYTDTGSASSILTTWANAVSGVTVTPSSGGFSGEPGSDVAYTLWVTNTGNCTDTFNIAISGDAWEMSAPSTVGPLEPDVRTGVAVTVTVPLDAHCADADTATVTFTSQRDGTTSDSSILTTSADAVAGVMVEPFSDSASGDPGTDVGYTLRVTNTGNCADTFTIAASGYDWPTDAPATSGLLTPGASSDIDVTVTVPQDALCGDGDAATIAFTSQSDGTTSTTSDLTTTASAVSALTVTPLSSTGSGEPSTDVLYTLQVTNTGNCADTFAIAASGYDWTTDAPATSGLLAPGAGTDVDVNVTVPQDALCTDSDTATITFTSQGDGTTFGSSILTTSAYAIYGVTVEPLSVAASGDPDTDVDYTLRVTNTGNCVDTFDVTASGYDWTPDVPATSGPLPPGAGANVDVSVSVPVCTKGGASDSVTLDFASQHDGTVAESADLTTTANQVAPIANADGYSTQEDTALVVSPPGILENDTDANCDTLTATLQTLPTEGAILLEADGSFTYTPTLNFHGEDSFTYYAYDGVLSTTATVILTVTSGDDDPVVDAGEDQTVNEGETVHFDGNFVDPAHAALPTEESLHWSFGDGYTATGTLAPSHVYRDNGGYTVTLTVTDLEGDAGHDSLLATVLNVPPSAHAGPDQKAVPGELLSFSGTFSDPGLDDTHSIQWHMGNGTFINDTLTVDYSYEAIGVYTVTLTVTDDDGGVGSDTAIITIGHRVYLPVVLKVFRP